MTETVNVIIDGNLKEVAIIELAQEFVKAQGNIIEAKAIIRDGLRLLNSGGCAEICYLEGQVICCKWHKKYIGHKGQAYKFIE